MAHQRVVGRLLPKVRIGVLLSVAVFVGFVAVSVAFGAGDELPKPQSFGLPFEKSASDTPKVISSMIKQVVLYTGVLAILALTWGGFLFITAFGQDEQVKKAKSVIKFAFIGVILSISAYAIIDIVNRLTV